jgi:hypothetical protein
MVNAQESESMKKHIMFHNDNTIPPSGWIWVFGSNLGGRHGAGAAKVARVNFRAEYGCGIGPTGSAYAIPTKTRNLQTLPLETIQDHVAAFCQYANGNQKKLFFVTRVGCGLAGYEDKDIAPLFKDASRNCNMPEEWRQYL